MGTCIRCHREGPVVVTAKTRLAERAMGMCQSCAKREHEKAIDEGKSAFMDFLRRLFS